MDLQSITKTYRRYSGHYDAVFGAVLNPGRRKSIKLVNGHARILEVGVGTGLALPYYPAGSRVIGIDISAEMLEKARERKKKQGLDHVEALLQMDAEQLSFPDSSFDMVLAMYVVSVVPHPERVLEEMRRVCAPDGDIIIVNHFHSVNPVMRAMEKGLSPFSRVLGFRTDLELGSLPPIPGFKLVSIQATGLLGMWKVIHYQGNGVGKKEGKPALRGAPELRLVAGKAEATVGDFRGRGAAN